MPDVAEKRRAFRRLHERGCFVMPNPWDVGSTRWLQHLGFPALATTSAGAAFAMGLPDSDRVIGCDTMIEHVRALATAADVPINADFGSGYGRDAAAVAANVRRCVATGVAGLSIEDATGDDAAPLLALPVAVARVAAARAAIDAAGDDVVLTARAECFVVGVRDVAEVVRRLRAYADAGADCLYAPGLATREDIRAVVEAVAPKPVNVLAGASHPPVDELAALGVRRVSIGSGLARVAWSEFMCVAKRIASEGRFDGLSLAVPYADLDRFFADDSRRRTGADRDEG